MEVIQEELADLHVAQAQAQQAQAQQAQNLRLLKRFRGVNIK